MNNTYQIMNWTDYFLNIAKAVSLRSNCIRAHVGAIIVGNDKKIKATGYNGTPSNVESCAERGECFRIKNKIPSGTRYETCRSIHAEQNAIIQAGQDRCKDATIYIFGHEMVCILCKRFIIQSGIKHIFLQKDDSSPIKYMSAEELKYSLEEE